MPAQRLHTCIALFRGINIGSTRSLPMKDLIRILEQLGYQGVRTYIQSGNAVFESGRRYSARDATAISEAVAAEFGFRPAVMLLESRDLRRAFERNPFPTDEGKFLHFLFLESKPQSPDLDSLQAVRSETEQFQLDGQVFYLYTPGGFAQSKVRERVERSLRVRATARNLNTVRKLLEMVDATVPGASSR